MRTVKKKLKNRLMQKFVLIHFKNKTKSGISLYHYVHSLQVLTISVQKNGSVL
jgi:hypothetical protein